MPYFCLDTNEVAPSKVSCRYHLPDVVFWAVQSRNFKAGMELMVRIGAVAEEEGHHPDLHLESWNKVYVVLSTHSIGRILRTSFRSGAEAHGLGPVLCLLGACIRLCADMSWSISVPWGQLLQ